MKVFRVITVNNSSKVHQLLSNYDTGLPFLKGDPVFVQHAQPFNHKSYYNQCVSLLDQNHKNLNAHICTTFLKFVLEEKSEPWSCNWSTRSAPSVFWWYPVKYLGHTTRCVSQPLLLVTSYVPVFPRLMMNCSILYSFNIVATRWKRLFYSRL